jgi:hypothetical protein
LDNSILGLDQQKVISYLYTYGNTRETDLVNYCVQRLGMSEVVTKKLVDEMVIYGRIERILHKELEPAVTYVKYGNMVPLELELQAISNSLGLGKVTNREVEAVKEILAKAGAIADKRIKRKTTLSET